MKKLKLKKQSLALNFRVSFTLLILLILATSLFLLVTLTPKTTNATQPNIFDVKYSSNDIADLPIIITCNIDSDNSIPENMFQVSMRFYLTDDPYTSYINYMDKTYEHDEYVERGVIIYHSSWECQLKDYYHRNPTFKEGDVIKFNIYANDKEAGEFWTTPYYTITFIDTTSTTTDPTDTNPTDPTDTNPTDTNSTDTDSTESSNSNTQEKYISTSSSLGAIALLGILAVGIILIRRRRKG